MLAQDGEANCKGFGKGVVSILQHVEDIIHFMHDGLAWLVIHKGVTLFLCETGSRDEAVLEVRLNADGPSADAVLTTGGGGRGTAGEVFLRTASAFVFKGPAFLNLQKA